MGENLEEYTSYAVLDLHNMNQPVKRGVWPWKMNSRENLTDPEQQELHQLLSKSKNLPPQLEDIWEIMDMIWDELGCDNMQPDQNRLDTFYRHPVWLLNDLFISEHGISLQHRHAIRDWIFAHEDEIKLVVDYGGGFGKLACLINDKISDVRLEIYEPYPGRYAKATIAKRRNIRFVSALSRDYDCLLAVDVLEHVADPLSALASMIESVRNGGYLIIANCFFPVIKCHLPGTFHLRYTFDLFAAEMGLKPLGPCTGSHAFIYKKHQKVDFNWRKIRIMEKLSRFVFPFLDSVASVYRMLKNIIRK